MKLDKKILYSHIRMLQNFAGCRLMSTNVPKNHALYECVKLFKNEYGNTEKYVTFMYSTTPLPDIDPLVFDVSIRLLSDVDIRNLECQCKEYGIKYSNYEK